MSRARRLQALWAELNAAHFAGALTPVPIRITRSRRTYGYFYGPNHRAASASIRISPHMADTPALVRDTLLHEMIHQKLYEARNLEWAGHGKAFQGWHLQLFGELYREE